MATPERILIDTSALYAIYSDPTCFIERTPRWLGQFQRLGRRPLGKRTSVGNSEMECGVTTQEVLGR